MQLHHSTFEAILGHLVQSLGVEILGGWTRWSPEVPSNPHDSVKKVQDRWISYPEEVRYENIRGKKNIMVQGENKISLGRNMRKWTQYRIKYIKLWRKDDTSEYFIAPKINNYIASTLKEHTIPLPNKKNRTTFYFYFRVGSEIHFLTAVTTSHAT